MNFVLLVFLFGFTGPHIGGQPYSTMIECENERAKLPEKIAERNATADPVKIIYYASVCTPVHKAPQGKDV
jgi:hypothetical protein